MVDPAQVPDTCRVALSTERHSSGSEDMCFVLGMPRMSQSTMGSKLPTPREEKRAEENYMETF